MLSEHLIYFDSILVDFSAIKLMEEEQLIKICSTGKYDPRYFNNVWIFRAQIERQLPDKTDAFWMACKLESLKHGPRFDIIEPSLNLDFVYHPPKKVVNQKRSQAIKTYPKTITRAKSN